MNILKLLAAGYQKSQRFVTKNISHILMAIGTSTSIGTLIFAVKVAPAANEAVTDAKQKKAEGADRSDPLYSEMPPKLTFWEWLKAVGKYYGPAAAMEMLSLACFWVAHGIDIRRQAIWAGVATTAQEALREYQKKVGEMIGKKGEDEVRNAQAQDFVDKNPPPQQTYILEGGAERDFVFKGQYFKSTWVKIKEAQNQANAEMIQHLYLSEADLMWFLDPERKYLCPDDDSGQVGWSVDRLIELDIRWANGPDHSPIGIIEVTDKDGFRYDPTPGFSRFG